MSAWPPITYAYDGSFSGFLTCVAESFTRKEYPLYFFPPGEDQFSLYPIRELDPDEALARRVYAGLRRKISLQGRQLVELSFLTCLPQKERHIYDYIYESLTHGPLTDLTDDRVMVLTNAVRHLTGEAHLLKGFVRFSDHSGVLIGEITPKNRVLPLLREHFCARFPNEAFLLYDRNHQEALCHAQGVWKIVPLEELTLNVPDESEEEYRSLWRRFYDSISIEARYNPKLRISNMPKRYWENMTEFQ